MKKSCGYLKQFNYIFSNLLDEKVVNITTGDMIKLGSWMKKNNLTYATVSENFHRMVICCLTKNEAMKKILTPDEYNKYIIEINNDLGVLSFITTGLNTEYEYYILTKNQAKLSRDNFINVNLNNLDKQLIIGMIQNHAGSQNSRVSSSLRKCYTGKDNKFRSNPGELFNSFYNYPSKYYRVKIQKWCDSYSQKNGTTDEWFN